MSATVPSGAVLPATDPRTRPRRSVLAGVLFGVGVAAFVDEVIFHQLLHWHHFYDRSTPSWGLVSDGLFHAAGWVCTVTGLFVWADLRRREAVRRRLALAGFCLGLGGFQLWDGTVQHKWWAIHEIRYGVDLLPYDLIWNVLAVLTLLNGAWLLRRERRAARV